MKRRIIITINSENVSDSKALEYVSSVIDAGKISKYQETPQYCFITTFQDKIKVYARDKKNINTDSFVIF